MNEPVIIGGGIAGLLTALHLAPEPVTLISRAPLGEQTSSAWAQGGIAAAVGADDSVELHIADTLAAGNGLCDPDAVTRIVSAGPAAIADLARRGVRFDAGLGLEAAHSRHRIVHADGDGTGREIVRALVAAVRAAPSITILHAGARRILTRDGAVSGVLATRDTETVTLSTGRAVIATGGVGGLFLHSTNPTGSRGQGLALAARAGAALADMEFVQFHPTALARNISPLPLISEAVRGEGAILIDEYGVRFMRDVPGAELAPRDVVARAIWAQIAAGRRMFLDARASTGARFAEKFPAIAAICAQAGIDPATQPIPVRPAAHYHMGGIAVDAAGRSTVRGLWAAGEAACTGLHGANRLASNSLLEAAVCARGVAADVAGSRATIRAGLPLPRPLPQGEGGSDVRAILSRGVGVLRDAAGLADAVRALAPSAETSDDAAVGLMIAVAALHRTESRGAHARTDFPQMDAQTTRTRWTLVQVQAAARVVGQAAPLARGA